MNKLVNGVLTPLTAEEMAQRETDQANALAEQAAEAEAQAITDAKQSKVDAISKIIVTTSQGNTFDGHDEARANMNEAITASSVLGLTSNPWKLANNSIATITVDEIKEALALAIQAKGTIILN